MLVLPSRSNSQTRPRVYAGDVIYTGDIMAYDDLFGDQIFGIVDGATITDSYGDFANDSISAILHALAGRINDVTVSAENIENATATDWLTQYLLKTPTTSARNTIQPSLSTVIPLSLKGAASQSADLLQLLNSSSSVLARFNENGYLGIGIDPTYPGDFSGGIRIGNTAVANGGAARFTGSDFEGYVPGIGWMSFTQGAEIAGSTGYVVSVTPTAESGRIAFFSNPTTIMGSANLFWDNTQRQLLINQIPGSSYAIDILGDVRATSLVLSATDRPGLTINDILVPNLNADKWDGYESPEDLLRADDIYLAGGGDSFFLTGKGDYPLIF